MSARPFLRPRAGLGSLSPMDVARRLVRPIPPTRGCVCLCPSRPIWLRNSTDVVPEILLFLAFRRAASPRFAKASLCCKLRRVTGLEAFQQK